MKINVIVIPHAGGMASTYYKLKNTMKTYSIFILSNYLEGDGESTNSFMILFQRLLMIFMSRYKN
ncbi:hypothetical protein HMPREF9396_0340 [Streptococcus sanguinis SK1059]|nr:hypothetical protein HMPREF9396_0340 [Streptococcus sanguinis SK1059]